MSDLLFDPTKLQRLLRKTESGFGRGPSADWRNKDFEDLSFEINLKSKILISPATLKRLFGKVKTSAKYTPQESTIKALQIFSGYNDDIISDKKYSSKWNYLVPLIIPLIFVVIWLFKQKMENSELKSCQLGLVKIEGNDSASAYFNYSVPKSKDSIFIDFGNNSDLIHVRGANKTISHFYGFPGYFDTKIRTRKKILKEGVKAFVPTTGWKALAHYFNKDLITRYFPVPFNGNVNKGIFHATRKNLASLGIDSTEIVVVRLDNYKKTQVSGDSFTLHSRFKNSSFWPGIRCFSVHYYVIGTKGQVYFKFTSKGCSSVAEYKTGEIYAQGSNKDLTNFTVDLHKWSDIEIKNTNKHVTVMIGDSLAFDGLYTNSIGEILGSTILFHGSGSVDYIYLNDGGGKAVFEEDF